VTLPLLRGGSEGARAVCLEAEEIVAGTLEARGRELLALLELCESPVEQILLAALCARWQGRVAPDGRRAWAHLAEHPEWAGLFRVVVEPQKVIHTPGATYRADLFVYVTQACPAPQPILWGATVVEVDGHEFHERTRTQATRDRRRDRDLLREGLRVLRFTGSEVSAAPFACAKEVDGLLCQTARETLEFYRVSGKMGELSHLIPVPDSTL
jgi:hypothetical protein